MACFSCSNLDTFKNENTGHKYIINIILINPYNFQKYNK